MYDTPCLNDKKIDTNFYLIKRNHLVGVWASWLPKYSHSFVFIPLISRLLLTCKNHTHTSVRLRDACLQHQHRFWPPYIRVHTANVLVENGDAFVHHAFMSRDVDHPWWFSIKVILRSWWFGELCSCKSLGYKHDRDFPSSKVVARLRWYLWGGVTLF